MREFAAGAPELAFAERVAAAVEQQIDRKPNVDFATVVLERLLGLPADSALAIFLLGRTVGWIAHAIEQAAHGALIRRAPAIPDRVRAPDGYPPKTLSCERRACVLNVAL